MFHCVKVSYQIKNNIGTIPCRQRTVRYQRRKNSFCNSFGGGWFPFEQSLFAEVQVLDRTLDKDPWPHFRELRRIINTVCLLETRKVSLLFCHKWARKIWIKLIFRVGILPCLWKVKWTSHRSQKKRWFTWKYRSNRAGPGNRHKHSPDWLWDSTIEWNDG